MLIFMCMITYTLAGDTCARVLDRVGFIPGRKVFLPFPRKKLGRNREEMVSSGKLWKKLGINREETEN